jgi:crotonobetainyl-CoA:carnitine CoA-transferase CaiB-like acyl-CoA transferase
MTETSFPQPLSGRLILDMSLLYPGPSASQMLASFGARVIKIEPSMGDPLRLIYPPVYEQLNRDKELAVLDLSKPEDQKLFASMAAKADAVIEGFRPGVMDRLGAGFNRLTKLNPKLVMTSISGYGATGPYADHPAHDMSVMAVAGYFSMPAQLSDEITRPNIRLTDVLAAQSAAYATVMAILEADRTGKGVHVDTSLFDATAAFSLQALLASRAPDAPAEAHPQVMADSTIYECACGGHVAIATLEDKFWNNFVAAATPAGHALRSEELANRRGRDKDKHALAALLTELFETRSRDEWIALLTDAETAVTPVWRGSEFLSDPHAEARGAAAAIGDGDALYSLFPALFNGQRECPKSAAPGREGSREELTKEFLV